MIDPRTVLIAIPAYDGKVISPIAGALANCHGLYAAVSIKDGCSHVSLARNLIAGEFLQSNFEWLVCVDADVAFTRRDLELLLEPCDVGAIYLEDVNGTRARITENQQPRPSRVITGLTVDVEPGTYCDYNTKTAGAADLLVCAEYSFKDETLAPVKLGLGFTRIHRSVFERLQRLRHEAGDTVEVSRAVIESIREYHADTIGDGYPDLLITKLLDSVQDPAGTPRLWQTHWKGRLYTDFFPSGPIISQFVPTGEWKGEDHGFWTLCMLAGLIPRIETRTKLVHFGSMGYPYIGEEAGGGQ